MAINYVRIGQRIQDLRKQKGMTVADLASKVNFTPKSIFYAEGGQAAFTLELLVNLCTALDVSPNQLLADEYTCSRSDSTQEQETLLNELKGLVISIREEMELDGETAEDVTVIKDTSQVIQEFRRTLEEYKQSKEVMGLTRGRQGLNKYSQPSSVAAKRGLSGRHW